VHEDVERRAVIVKRVDAQTRSKVSINELLRL
jgi:tetrahydrodipicolinate N-succinyltransferase